MHTFQVRTISGVWFIFFVCVVVSVSPEFEGECVSHFAGVNLSKNCLNLTFPESEE